ncbi:superoxide dismutase family protein [Sphaerisporangium sp. B11E5]|uniref:superoxide dismutase family protein n=1 Tax=Sphaerisporangium sp. B11E5 TaxID=3153563 RepID=UPI00325DA996
MAVRAGVVALLVPLGLLTGASGGWAQGGPAVDEREIVLAVGRFEPYAQGREAITYDQKLVPVNAAAAVAYVPGADGRMQVMLRTRGLVPNRQYGAHAHTNQCGARGDDAGPHYQHMKDPKSPSTDPKYANPRNEIWLDFTTDAQGNGVAKAVQAWRFTDRQAKSVVIHAEHTHTGAGHAGQAGARLACLTVPF